MSRSFRPDIISTLIIVDDALQLPEGRQEVV